MHCKSCLKRAQYFSTCMHPYCESCYKKNQTFCNECKTGMKKNRLWELLEQMTLRETYTTYPSYASIKGWFCGYSEKI